MKPFSAEQLARSQPLRGKQVFSSNHTVEVRCHGQVLSFKESFIPWEETIDQLSFRMPAKEIRTQEMSLYKKMTTTLLCKKKNAIAFSKC